LDVLITAVYGGIWLLNSTRSMSAPLVVAPEDESDIAETAQAPVAARRARRRISLADAIFKTLCLLIAGFLILIFGIVGGFYFYVAF
jgi:hypothetical protein